MPFSSAPETPVARPFFVSTRANDALSGFDRGAVGHGAGGEGSCERARAAASREAAAHGHRVFRDPLEQRAAGSGRPWTAERSEQRTRRHGGAHEVGLEPLVDEVGDRHRHPPREPRPIAPTQRAHPAPRADQPPPVTHRRVVERRRRLTIERAEDAGDAMRRLHELTPDAGVARRDPVDRSGRQHGVSVERHDVSVGAERGQRGIGYEKLETGVVQAQRSNHVSVHRANRRRLTVGFT